MAGEIQIGGTTFATESGGTVTVSNVDSATNRQNLGLEIGVDVQSYDADTTKNDVANTFTASQIISVTDNTNAALRVTQLGTGNAIVVEDSTNPDSTPFVVDSSGNVLIGTTTSALASTSTVEGIALNSDATTQMSRAGVVQYLNRISTDGTILDLRKDGTSVGIIGVNSEGNTYITSGSSNVGIGFSVTTRRVLPQGSGSGIQWIDDTIDLGSGSYSWQDIYATNGTIQTSDRNEKQDIEELSEAEQRVAVAAKSLMRKFRWKSAVAKKGDEARIHFGIIAQDLQAAFEAEGLDAGRYAMFISSTWWETSETYTNDEGVEQTRTNTYDTAEEAPEGAVERTRLGVRYSELLAFIIAAI